MTNEQNAALQTLITQATKQLDTSHSYLGMTNCAIIHNARRALLEIAMAEPKAKKEPKRKANMVDFMKLAGRIAARGGKVAPLAIQIKDGKATATDLDSWITFNSVHPEGYYHLKNGVMLAQADKENPDHPDMGVPVAYVKMNTEILAKIYRAASVDETHRVLNGVCIGEDGKGGFYAIATDGRRLHIFERGDSESVTPWEAILPHQAVKELLELHDGDFELGVYKKWVYAGGDGWGYMSRLIDGVYPNFRQVIPAAQQHSVTFDKAAVLDQLKTVILPYYKATEKKNAMRMTLALDAMTFTMDGEQGRSFSVPCQSTGVTSACFNVEYVIDMLEGQPDTPVMHFEEAHAPVLLKGDGYTGVLMPMRVA
jgi:hypothetical protein